MFFKTDYSNCDQVSFYIRDDFSNYFDKSNDIFDYKELLTMFDDIVKRRSPRPPGKSNIWQIRYGSNFDIVPVPVASDQCVAPCLPMF